MAGIWIDTDMGSDDAFAVILAARHVPIDGMSLVAGNAPLAQVARNAAGFAGMLGWDFPVFAGAARPILGPLETARRVLGDSALPLRGEAPLFDADACAGAASFGPFLPSLSAWLEAADEPRSILALGPLTNLAILALARPDLLDRIGRLVWMGGAVGRGNHTPSAEFNAFADPESVQILLDRGVALHILDLDACRRVLIDEADVTALAAVEGRNSVAMAQLLGGYLDIALTRGRPAMALYDPVAAAALIAPELFTFTPARIQVECSGALTRGRTVTDFTSSRPNGWVATELDAPAIRERCLSALAQV